MSFASTKRPFADSYSRPGVASRHLIQIAAIRVRRYALSSDAEIILLELVEHEGADCRSPVRKALTPLTVNVEYADICSLAIPFHRAPLS